MAKGKFLSLDYGKKSIGMAVSDADRIMAFGRGVLKNEDEGKTIGLLCERIRDEGVVLVVVGLPLGKAGEDTPQTLRIKDFSGKLEDRCREMGLVVKFDYIDESFSTFEANQELANLNVKGSERKKTEDELAAIILANRYIDSEADLQ